MIYRYINKRNVKNSRKRTQSKLKYFTEVIIVEQSNAHVQLVGDIMEISEKLTDKSNL